jgi:DNA-directed RNA polymerase specialized sigma24 family protein
MSYPHTNQKENQLAVRVRESDRNAYNTLFSLLWEPMYTYAGSILMNEALAQDLVQEVFMDYWQRRKAVVVDNIKSYLFKTIWYKCYNTLRNIKFLDFDRFLGLALDYVDTHPNTLLVVTADHETDSLSIGKHHEMVESTGSKRQVSEKVTVYFNTNLHSGELIPVFVVGKGADYFQGLCVNNQIYHKIIQATHQANEKKKSHFTRWGIYPIHYW